LSKDKDMGAPLRNEGPGHPETTSDADWTVIGTKPRSAAVKNHAV